MDFDIDGIEDRLVVRPIRSDERARWIALCNEHHYLGFKGSFGYSLLYCACLGDEWIALLSWGACALRLKSRDDWIGWGPELRTVRSNLVINNNRFLILPSFAHLPNLASMVLARNLRRLQQDWYVRFRRTPVLAESFVDPTRFKGTSYLAAGWLHIGNSKGFRRVPSGFEFSGEPKMIFVKPLQDDALEVLRNPAHVDEMGREQFLFDPFTLPIEGKDSLIDLIKATPDPRSRLGRQHSLVSILGIATCAMLAGAKSFKAIEGWSQKLSEKQLAKLRCRKKRPPGLTTFKETLYRIDAEQFDAQVNNWLARHAQHDARVKAIAVDGKTLRGSYDKAKAQPAVHLLSALLHNEKIIVAQRKVDDKTNEIPEVVPLLRPLDLVDVFVSLDAMHCQRETMEYVANTKRGFYIVTVKKNQMALWQRIEAIFALFEGQLGSECEETVRDHGRIDSRKVTCITVTAKDFHDLGFDTIRQVCKIDRVTRDLKAKPLRAETVFVITNAPSTAATAADLLALIRNHWRIENSSHYVRDVTLNEDNSRIRSGAAPHVMATLRNLSIGILRCSGSSQNIAQGLRDAGWGKKSTVMRAIGVR